MNSTMQAGLERLILVADPMCSWCYGFAPSLQAFLAQAPEIELDLVLGGLRPDPGELLTAEGIAFRLGHWRRVQALSGLPFNPKALREGMRYSTEPISRAVVLAREQLPGQGARQLAVFHALQRGFYEQGLDTTAPEVLAELLSQALAEQGVNLDAASALQALQSPPLARRTREDFERARSLHVNSFPTLLRQHGVHAAQPLHAGYASAAQLRELWLAGVAHPS
ncbi:putative protein-disulfide isomerase [Inhella inkyongensis]|uniref:DSBA-like thioredoxin domain-containing protein n=1 Tax=Inhella inkyongensis TaxID=392593 RepID=A0A840S6C1_9BURK|nr:DsbA family protein [Inhella inkyongensis]MBB5205975.1 putative protein-disulfide isomerase [Inhella inkyongensis]